MKQVELPVPASCWRELRQRNLVDANAPLPDQAA
jgi:hypothetical protein